MRSGLTILGILIGIAAVILTVGLGRGATAIVNSDINTLGTNLLIVSPGSTTTGLGTGRVRHGIHAHVRQCPGAGQQSGLPRHRRGGAPGADRRQPSWPAARTGPRTVYGSTSHWLRSVAGRWPSARFSRPADVTNDDNVVVLGQTTAEELGLFSPVGQTIEIGTVPFTVIGVLNGAGSSSTAPTRTTWPWCPLRRRKRS